jgi:DNA repair protein RadD
MTQTLRGYQTRTVRQTLEQWASGHRAVCVVAPCGAGKTTIGSAIAQGFRRVIWAAHRRELVKQAAERLRSYGLYVGIIAPGERADSSAPVQVGTIQTLLARDIRPDADLVVLDECHHFSSTAEYWSSFLAAYPSTKILGLTATPERRDGSPLGDIFDALVVAASYSELIEQGYLAPCVVYAPPPDKASSGWSCDPVMAYTKYAPGSLAFAFFDRVARSTEWERAFCLAGINARTIDGKTPAAERAETLRQFSAGMVRVLCNVACLTEGTDVPAATTCIMARCPDHSSLFLQIVGRILRTHPGKTHALLLDISDATSRHGYPTEDREYSLTGKAIQRASAASVRRCGECMAMFPNGLGACPMCGWVPPKPKPVEVRIYGAELQRVYAGADTPEPAKAAEFDRLLDLIKRKGLSLYFAIKEYRKLFGADPPQSALRALPESVRRAEYEALRATQQTCGFKPGFVGARYKSMFGVWPPREWGMAPIAARSARPAGPV